MTKHEARPRGSERGRAARGSEQEIGDFASRVLDVAESIPPGRVMSYGDIAEYVGQGGPRQVGRVMALWGGGVPWWRVVHADGSLLAGHEREALRHYRRERTPLRKGADGTPGRLDMRKARWSGETDLA
jgi:alkylated DNA nucleotide flippase Atl1